jgi:hypothetical protein
MACTSGICLGPARPKPPTRWRQRGRCRSRWRIHCYWKRLEAVRVLMRVWWKLRLSRCNCCTRVAFVGIVGKSGPTFLFDDRVGSRDVDPTREIFVSDDESGHNSSRSSWGRGSLELA